MNKTSEKQLAGEKAVEFVKNGMTVGLGTGSTVYYTIQKLGEMLKNGLNIRAVSTSQNTTNLAQSLDIPLCSLDDINTIDVTIDGADEVDEDFNGIKGGGGALLFEKIVASVSAKNIWVVDSSKCVQKMGRFPLSVEVLTFGHTHVYDKLKNEGMNPVLRKTQNKLFLTDSGNCIIDLHLGRIDEPEKLASWLLSIPGVVEHGMFINMVDIVVVGKVGSTEMRMNDKK